MRERRRPACRQGFLNTAIQPRRPSALSALQSALLLARMGGRLRCREIGQQGPPAAAVTAGTISWACPRRTMALHRRWPRCLSTIRPVKRGSRAQRIALQITSRLRTAGRTARLLGSPQGPAAAAARQGPCLWTGSARPLPPRVTPAAAAIAAAARSTVVQAARGACSRRRRRAPPTGGRRRMPALPAAGRAQQGGQSAMQRQRSQQALRAETARAVRRRPVSLRTQARAGPAELPRRRAPPSVPSCKRSCPSRTGGPPRVARRSGVRARGSTPAAHSRTACRSTC